MRTAWLTAWLVALSIGLGRAEMPMPPQEKERVTVLLFVSVDCPVSNRYAPEIQRLQKKFAPEQVRFQLVYPNPADTPEAIRAHIEAYGFGALGRLAKGDKLVSLSKATITPEAAVFDSARRLVYRGRIDDRFVELMKERREPTTHDLEDAISSVLAGKAIIPATTQAVGCVIADF